jgi:hypothetical protein
MPEGDTALPSGQCLPYGQISPLKMGYRVKYVILKSFFHNKREIQNSRWNLVVKLARRLYKCFLHS